MSDINIIIQNSLIDKSSELIITDMSWKIIFRNNAIDFEDSQWSRWARLYMDEVIGEAGLEWEIADKEQGKYYKVRSFSDYYKGKQSLIHHIYDISDYAKLFRELSEYTKEWRRISSCQSDLIGALSNNPCGCMKIALKYFEAKSVVLFIERHEVVIRYYIDTSIDTIQALRVDQVPYLNDSDTTAVFSGLSDRSYTCCCSGRAMTGAGYGLYVLDEEDVDLRYKSMLYNEFKLYLENALLREQIVYENEHDNLTGLYNKAKLNELVLNRFSFADRISVLNMDLNDLKKTNDKYGHDAGNNLIIRAGESVKKILSDDIYGFRVGGDEFIVIALGLNREEIDELVSKWKKEVDKLNQNAEHECVIACGIGYGEAPFDFKQIMDHADKLMYEDKRNIKIARGEDPESR